MKKIILLALLASFFWYACDDDDTVAPAIVGMEISGEDLLSGDTLLYDTTAQTSRLKILVSGEWTVNMVEDVDWCGFTRSALPGVNELLIQVASNNGPDERTCQILLDGGGKQRKLTIDQIGSTPALKVAPEKFTALSSDSTVISFRVITNVAYEVSVAEGEEWILPLEQTGVDTSTFRFAIRTNGVNVRSGKILVEQTQGSNEKLVREIPVFQQNRPAEYTPGDPNSLGQAQEIIVKSATAVGTKGGQTIDNFWTSAAPLSNTYDGSYTAESRFNSKENDCFPVILTYHFDATNLDYIDYYPRADNNENGHLGKFTLQYQVNGGSFEDYKDYDFGEKKQTSRMSMNQTLKNVTAIRFIVNSGKNGYVSCGEMDFYVKPELPKAMDLFTDKTCSELKPEVTREQIAALDSEEDSFLKELAYSLYNKTYPLERVQVYQPYMTVETLSEKLKTSAYSYFENPTGIFFTSGTHVIFMDETNYNVSLSLADWTKEGNEKRSTYVLTPGINTITIQQDGLGYISYYTDDYESAPDIKVHIATGLLNGYFDLERGDQNAYWRSLLENEETKDCKILDIRGKYVQLAFDKASLSANNLDRGREMIQEYDNIIKMEQDVMGIDQFGWRTTNRMFARRSYSGNPNANGLGVSFPSLNVKPENIRTNSWEIGHEFGHVNQVRPGMKWQGTTEVTNNIYAATVQYHYTPDKLRLEDEQIGDGAGGAAMVGNRFNCYFNNGIIGGQNWLFQKGQNNPNPETGAGDLFIRLCPFWQLQLYNKFAGLGVSDFYPQIMDIVRNTNENGLSNKELQFNFMRNACDVMKTNMLDFFEKCGMLKLIDRDVSDYSGAIRLTITQEDIDQFKAEIEAKDYPLPVSPMVYYISGNSVDAFKNKAAVVGTTGEGVSGSGSSRLVIGSAWKNVVVFETYAGEELVKATLPFTNYADKTATTVAYPDGSTRIEAVAWDGKRTLVYGTR